MSELSFPPVHPLSPNPSASPVLTPGQRLARGVARALLELDFIALEEVPLASGLRADLLAIGPKGEIWLIECKSSRADFQSDHKWQGYVEWADRFFFAVGPDFPTEILPAEHGLILADAYGGSVMRKGAEAKLAGARRSTLTRAFARQAALRLARANGVTSRLV